MSRRFDQARILAGLVLLAFLFVRPAGAQVGRGCSPFKPCPSGFSCHPGKQECFHSPRQVEEPCSAGFGCGGSLSCQPLIQKCYNVPRRLGEPCMAGFTCGSGLRCAAVTQKCVGDEKPTAAEATTGRVIGVDLSGTVCWRRTQERGVGRTGICNASEEKNGLLCYPKCPNGYGGVGPVCWAQCAPNQVACGAGCAKSTDACVGVVIDQVASTGMMVASVAALIASDGAVAPLLASKKTATKVGAVEVARFAARVTKDQVKEQLKAALQRVAQDNFTQATSSAANTRPVDPASKANALGLLNNDPVLSLTAEALANAHNGQKIDLNVLIPSLADVDPTGILAVANAFNKPMCGAP